VKVDFRFVTPMFMFVGHVLKYLPWQCKLISSLGTQYLAHFLLHNACIRRLLGVVKTG